MSCLVLQFHPQEGRIHTNLEKLLPYAHKAHKLSLPLIVSPMSVLGGQALDFQKWAFTNEALEKAYQSLAKTGASICLLGQEPVWIDQKTVQKGGLSHTLQGRRFKILNPGLSTLDQLDKPDSSAHEADYLLASGLSYFDKDRPACATKPPQGVIWLNSVGMVEQRVQEGGSWILSQRMPYLQETLWELQPSSSSHTLLSHTPSKANNQKPEALLWQALIIGIQDYMSACELSKVVLGLSGGIDSALAATLVQAALGPQSVSTFMLRTQHTSELSLDLARCLADNLQVGFETLDLEPSLAPLYSLIQTTKGHEDTSDSARALMAQNLQSRLRALILMGQANLQGALLIGTSNQSEIEAGYGTLYGDLAAGFNVLKSLRKSEVYSLASYANEQLGELIPEGILTRAPSAELAPDQRDSDDLPSYDTLEIFMQAFLWQGESIEGAALKAKLDTAEAHKLAYRFWGNEFKRKQAPPGLILSSQSFHPAHYSFPTASFSQLWHDGRKA